MRKLEECIKHTLEEFKYSLSNEQLKQLANNIRCLSIKDKEPIISIEYDGKFPNYCHGILTAYIDEKKYVFDNDSLFFNLNYWSIISYPNEFPECYKKTLENIINKELNNFCCGGCTQK